MLQRPCHRQAGRVGRLVTTETSGLNIINFANYRTSLLSDNGCTKISLCGPGDNLDNLEFCHQQLKNKLVFTLIRMLCVTPSKPCVLCLPSLSQVMVIAFKADRQIMLVCCSTD